MGDSEELQRTSSYAAAIRSGPPPELVVPAAVARAGLQEVPRSSFPESWILLAYVDYHCVSFVKSAQFNCFPVYLCCFRAADVSLHLMEQQGEPPKIVLEDPDSEHNTPTDTFVHPLDRALNPWNMVG